MIVLHHANADCIPTLPEVGGLFGWALWRVRNLGWTAVDLFFVLSGFLFAKSVILGLDQGRFSLKQYYRKRASRIVPTYYALIAVLALSGTGIVFGGESGFLPWMGVPVYLAFLHNYLACNVCGPIWFLAVIVHAYLFLPPVFIGLHRWMGAALSRRMGWIAGFVALGSVLARSAWMAFGDYHSNAFMFSHFRMDALFIGIFVFCALHEKSAWVEKIRRHSYVCTLMCLAVISIAMFCARDTVYMFTIGYSLLAMAYGGLIILLTQDRVNAASLVLRALFPLAGWSYGIYLWHWYLIRIFKDNYVQVFQWIAELEVGAVLSTLLQIGLFLLISVFFGMLSTWCIEQPAARFFPIRKKRE